jgi:hypothetical protein
MRYPARIPEAFGVSLFCVLMAFCWLAWWLHLRGRVGEAAWFIGVPCLLTWSIVLARTQRALAWLAWLSLVAMMLLGLWLPAN